MSSAIVRPCVACGCDGACAGCICLRSIRCCTRAAVYFAVPLFVQICFDQCRCALMMFVNSFSHPGHVDVVTCALSGLRILRALALCADSPCFVVNALSHC